MMVETWILPILIVVAGGTLLTAALLTTRDSTRTIVWRAFWCPLKQLRVNVAFLASVFRRDEYHDVVSCTAFANPCQVSCDKRCLELPEAKMPSTPEGVLAEAGER